MKMTNLPVKFSKTFRKQYKKAPKKIQDAFDIRLDTFVNSPSIAILRVHQLTGKYQGYKSINVTGDWRALFIEKVVGSELVNFFDFFGTHSQLYG